jgi:site-specific recombinase XerC
MTTKLIQKSEIENNNLKLIVKKLANESPELKDLNKEQLEQIAKIVITQRLTNEMNERANIENISYRVEKDIFLMTTSKSGSQYTKSAYREALLEYEKFCKRNKINIFMVNYAQADDFIYSLEGSPNSKRLKIAAISSFYSYIHRRYSVVKNPIRGTKARPTSKKVTELEIPDDADMMMILNNLPEIEKTAVCIMAYRGLRIGALNKLKVWGTKYQSISKGKAITGELPI